MRILAVDDDKNIRDLLPVLLEQAGYFGLTTEASAEDAMKLLESSERLFDCILVDINMPGINGIDLCAQIRQLHSYRHTPIMMLTAIREIEIIGRAFKAGATDYIIKPFDLAEIGAKLKIADELSRARHSAMLSSSSVGLLKPRNNVDSVGQYNQVFQDGTEGLIDYTALGNYARQMSAYDLSDTQVFSILIDQFKIVHATSSPTQALSILTRVAEATVSSLSSIDHMAAYAAHGAFVIVANSKDTVAIIELEADIQRRTDRLSINRATVGEAEIRISVGRPSRLNAAKNRRVKSSFERAIDRAEFRMKKKRL
jgi:DNA-binding response OmpR family regulator